MLFFDEIDFFNLIIEEILITHQNLERKHSKILDMQVAQ